jgi:hypothetical protein
MPCKQHVSALLPETIATGRRGSALPRCFHVALDGGGSRLPRLSLTWPRHVRSKPSRDPLSVAARPAHRRHVVIATPNSCLAFHPDPAHPRGEDDHRPEDDEERVLGLRKAPCRLAPSRPYCARFARRAARTPGRPQIARIVRRRQVDAQGCARAGRRGWPLPCRAELVVRVPVRWTSISERPQRSSVPRSRRWVNASSTRESRTTRSARGY